MLKFLRLKKPFNLKYFDSVESTNDAAASFASQGCKPWTIVCANEQKKGKGRLGRKWISKKGNIFFSIILKPDLKVNHTPQLNFVASLAIYDTLRPFLPREVAFNFKWPNDLLLNEKKFCGILIETSFIGDTLDWLVLGIGINVLSFPKGTIFPATSLKEMGCKDLSDESFLQRFLENFKKYFVSWEVEGFNRVKRAWLKKAYRLNENISLNMNSKKIIGKFIGIDNSGQIILKLNTEKKKIFNVGDILG